ncbi:MAG TPA: AbrB/MazE/SpoVT family DNA-binding domain-containing protein [Bacteroidota bacterium]|nr:AbrB/MazE/SpoVT family DNA-binding domain-containing protein [Bacteroidota bacterium]
MAAVKVGVSRQVAIPKKLHDQLGLSPGDYLEIELVEDRLILTPKALVEKRLAESIEDYRKGRSYGPFATAKQAIRSLHSHARRRRKRKAS